MNFSGTNAWQHWTDVYSSTPFALTAGTHRLRLEFPGRDFNRDEFELVVLPNPVPLCLDTRGSGPTGFRVSRSEYDRGNL